jgi:hypothetical protein
MVFHSIAGGWGIRSFADLLELWPVPSMEHLCITVCAFSNLWFDLNIKKWANNLTKLFRSDFPACFAGVSINRRSESHATYTLLSNNSALYIAHKIYLHPWNKSHIFCWLGCSSCSNSKITARPARFATNLAAAVVSLGGLAVSR